MTGRPVHFFLLSAGVIFLISSNAFSGEILPAEAGNETGEHAKIIATAVQNAEATIRDPFEMRFHLDAVKPVVAETGEFPVSIDVKLQGVGVGPRNAYAILNGKIYREGEEKNGIRLVAVHKEEAVIEMAGIKRTLNLVPEEAVKSDRPSSVRRRS